MPAMRELSLRRPNGGRGCLISFNFPFFSLIFFGTLISKGRGAIRDLELSVTRGIDSTLKWLRISLFVYLFVCPEAYNPICFWFVYLFFKILGRSGIKEI